MSISHSTTLVSSSPLVWKQRWEKLSQWSVVMLAFIIPISTALTHVALAILMLFWFLSGDLVSKTKIIFAHPISKFILGFYGIYIVGSFYSQGSIHFIMEQLWKMSKVLYFLFLIPLAQDKQCQRHAFLAFGAAMLITLGVGFVKIYDLHLFPLRHTAACHFKNHIDTNLMMSFACFLVAHTLIFSKSLAYRTVGGILITLMSFYILWLSDGRSGYIVFALLWILFFLQRFYGMKSRFIFLGVLGLSLLLSLVVFSSAHFQKRLNAAFSDLVYYQQGDTHTSLGCRLEYLKETTQLIKTRPWFGFGTGSFNETYLAHAQSKQISTTTNPHNEYLNISMQLGIVGLIALLTLFFSMIKVSFSLPRLEKHLVQGLVLALMVGCLANSWLMDFTSGHFFIVLLALCFGAWSPPIKANKGRSDEHALS